MSLDDAGDVCSECGSQRRRYRVAYLGVLGNGETSPLAAGRGRALKLVVVPDVRGIQVSRHLPGQVTASMTCREQDDRWGAIVIHLRAPRRAGETWKADQLERLVNSRHELRRDPEVDGPPDLSDRIRLVEGERTLAEGARGAAVAVKELRQLPADERDKSAMKALRQQPKFWSAKVNELDDEILI